MPPKPAAPKTGSKPVTPKPGGKAATPKPGGAKAGAKGKKGAEEKTPEQIEQERVLRNSIDHEAKIRDQIAALTGKLEGVLNKSDDNDPGTEVMDKILEENKNNPKRGPKKKVSLKDGPKRTISVQLPPEIFEKIQQDELRDEMERNSDLAGFMDDQGLGEYTEVLKRRGFKNVKDLSGLEEADIDFKVKPVHRTRLLWVATTQKMFLQEDGEKLPDVAKVKVDAADDPVPERETPRPKRPPGKKPPPGKKAPPGKKPPPAKKPPPKNAGDGGAAEPVVAEPIDAEEDFDDMIGDDDYPIIEGDVVGIELPPQPRGVTRLIFGSGPFGVTVYGTGNGLVVTHVEPEGSGAEQRVEVGDHVVELNGVPVSPTISDREFVEQLMSLSRPVVLGFTRQGKSFVEAAEDAAQEEAAQKVSDAGAPETPEGYTVGGISMDEVDPEKNLADLFPGAGLDIYLEALKEMGAEKMEDLAYLRRSDLQDLDMEIAPADKKKLLELGLVAFLTKEGLGACVAYIRSVGVDMVDDLVYLKQSDVALMDLKQEYKDKLMDVLGRES
mmetsp:Transcript_27133/g.46155  ORF Transcript_27133/g.46155 Transcript_27133/m.46155 type:complete len:554 (-) Transcript_27133:712-2373(-)